MARLQRTGTAENPKPTDESVSKQLAVKFFGKLMSLNSDVDIDNVDLNAEPPPPYSYAQYRACWYPVTVPGYVPTAEENTAAVYAKEQAEKFNQADVLVLTMPLWNFSMPGGMKTWIDHIIAPGLTFYNEEEKRKPLHKVKRMILIVASGEAPSVPSASTTSRSPGPTAKTPTSTPTVRRGWRWRSRQSRNTPKKSPKKASSRVAGCGWRVPRGGLRVARFQLKRAGWFGGMFY